MNGPEHYREAERLLARVDHFVYGDGADPVTGGATAAQAQVHATLALVAAIANHQSGESSTSLAEVPTAWDGAQGDRATWPEVTR